MPPSLQTPKRFAERLLLAQQDCLKKPPSLRVLTPSDSAICSQPWCQGVLKDNAYKDYVHTGLIALYG